MYTITKKQFNALSDSYAGTWSSDDIHGTNYNGLKTLLIWEPGAGTCLIIETIHFKIVETEKENINYYNQPIKSWQEKQSY